MSKTFKLTNRPPGLGLIITIGRYAGFYLMRGKSPQVGWLLCLGWLSLRVVPIDMDVYFCRLLQHAIETSDNESLSS